MKKRDGNSVENRIDICCFRGKTAIWCSCCSFNGHGMVFGLSISGSTQLCACRAIIDRTRETNLRVHFYTSINKRDKSAAQIYKCPFGKYTRETLVDLFVCTLARFCTIAYRSIQKTRSSFPLSFAIVWEIINQILVKFRYKDPNKCWCKIGLSVPTRLKNNSKFFIKLIVKIN